MKNTMKKMSALLMALVMCASCMMTALAHSYDEKDVVRQYVGYAADEFDVSAVAQEQADGTYAVTYTAKLTMSAEMAYGVHTWSLTEKDKLKSLDFVCELKDTLIAQLEDTDSVTFNFDSEIFEEKDDNAVEIGADDIKITFKLKSDAVDNWGVDTGAVVNALTEPITITASKIVTADQMSAATGITNADSIKATVVLTGLAAPQLMAEDTGTLTKSAYRAPSSGGSSSNGSVNVKDSANGKLSVNTTWANPGQTVTVTATPDAGYEVDEVTVIDANGNKVTVNKTGDNKYTFKMPATKATVSAKFVKDGTAADDEEVVLETATPEETGVDELLNTDDHMAYMNGDNKGNFRPNAGITRAEVCQMFYNLLRDKSIAKEGRFADVAEDAWYAQAVNKMAELGIVNGKGDGRFAPNEQISRAEFATIVVRFARTNDHKASFVDVPTSHWAYPYISVAAGYGWIGGTGNNKYEPERKITRAEAATLANRILGRSADKAEVDAGAARVFPDVAKSHWAYYEIAEAATNHEYTVDEVNGEELWAEDAE